MRRYFGASHVKSFKLFLRVACLLLPLAFCAANTKSIATTPSELALSQPLTIKWRYQSDRMSNLTPATDGRTVFLPLGGGMLVALRGDTGQLIWRAEAGGEFSSAPVADDRSVYIATQSQVTGDQKQTRGTLRAISKETGVTLWMRTLPGPLRGSLAVGQTGLFGGSDDGRVHAFDKRTGLSIWVNQYAEAFSGHPAVSGNLLYIGSDEGNLFVLNQSTGEHAWHYRTHGPIKGAIAVLNDVVYFGSGDGYVYAVSELRRSLIWKRRTGAAVEAVAPVSNGLIAVSLDNFAYLLSLNKGSLLWRRQMPGRISARPITAADGALFTPLSTDSAIVLGLKDGKPVNTLAIGEENSSSAAPIAVENLVLVSTPHGLLAFATPKP